MLTKTAWATGFLTRLVLDYLKTHHPSQMRGIDPHAFFKGIEGFETLKDPQALLLDSHAWLPEEVLREVLRTAERVSGRKEIAYEAALDYFIRSAEGRNPHPPFIFEIIARMVDDVRTVALCSSLWATAYTTFLRLQSISLDPDRPELIILCQSNEGFRPLLSNHYMVKGNFEGFVRLYDHVEGAYFEEEYLQYRIRDIVDEFDQYEMEESGAGLRIVDRRRHRTVAAFEPVLLAEEEIPFYPDRAGMAGFGSLITAHSGKTAEEGLILHPHSKGKEPGCWRILSSRVSDSTSQGEGTSSALRVVRGGRLRSGSIEYFFREGGLYEAPYSRYRFRWRERKRMSPEAGFEERVQKITGLLFGYLEELRATQQRLLAYAAENKALAVENIYLRKEADQGQSYEIVSCSSAGMQDVFDMVQQVAPTDSTVLITGETGTGKEIIARRIHQSGNRRDRRFMALNCGAVPEGLLESELFGHERGAFTGALSRKIGKFEWADHGTLFLDEIGEIPPSMQVKLLRILQDREIFRVGSNEPVRLDVRIIAATNQDLKTLMKKGLFRSDLYYRLNVIPIHLPPLRERPEDLPALAEHFLARFSRKLRKNVRVIPPSVLDLMKTYSWPGNIRELENILERAVTLIPADRTDLSPDLLPSEIHHAVPPEAVSSPVAKADLPGVGNVIDRIEWKTLVNAMETAGSMDTFLRKIEWSMARRAIHEYGSKTEAARVLKRTYRWIRKLEKEMEEGPSA